MYSFLESSTKFIYDTLKADAVFMALIPGGLYDGAVPDHLEAIPPYVILGEKLEVPDNALDRIGRRCELTIHIWTRYRGSLQGLAIASRIIALLDQGQMTMASPLGWGLAQLRLDMNEELIEDIDLRHRILRFIVRGRKV